MIVTLCGSTRFKQEFEQINAELTLSGHIVLAPGVFVHASQTHITEEQKHKLDELHRRKIDMSSAVYIVDVDGYIRDSTRSEIEYAKQNGKPVWYWSELHA